MSTVEGRNRMGKERKTDIFGAVRMGYLVIGSRKIDEWRRFGADGLGLHLAFESATELAFRMDDHARRLIVMDDPSADPAAGEPFGVPGPGRYGV